MKQILFTEKEKRFIQDEFERHISLSKAIILDEELLRVHKKKGKIAKKILRKIEHLTK